VLYPEQHVHVLHNVLIGVRVDMLSPICEV
jgi:hypothetical protein